MGGKHHSRTNSYATRQAQIARAATEKIAARKTTVPVQPPVPADTTAAKPNPYDRLRAKIDASRQTDNPKEEI